MGKRGRGRGKSAPGDTDQTPTPKPKIMKVPAKFFPVTDRDDEPVGCSDCTSFQGTFREFRIHNIQYHYNIATTSDDETVRDHKFYARKLNEVGKLTKTSVFVCPRPICDSRYKSALGLSYHLETCGKTKEEIDACMIPCEVCSQKFTLPNLNWHRKTHHRSNDAAVPESEPSTSQTIVPQRKQRQSAVKAREFLADADIRGSSKDEPDEDDTNEYIDHSQESPQWQQSQDDDGDEFMVDVKRESWFCEPPMDICLEGDADPMVQRSKQKIQSVLSARPDMASQAVKYLQVTTDDPNVWDTPKRNKIDPFVMDVNIVGSPLEDVHCQGTARLYLPGMEESVEFKVKSSTMKAGDTKTPAFTHYHRLSWFESEIVDSPDSNFILYTGGPVTSMAWHLCGNYIAIATMKHFMETPDMCNIGRRRASIQIYRHVSCSEPPIKESDTVDFQLGLVLGFDYGYVNHLQWGNFWPDSCDPYFNEQVDPATAREARLGYLCCAFEDSTCRILSLKRSDFGREPNFVHREGYKIRVYKKVPEVILLIPDTFKLTPGQCTRFDWHEGNRYFVAGYASGVLAVFDLQSKSKLLRIPGTDGECSVTFHPFWVFRGHKSLVTGIHLDPGDPRYFYTASMDRFLKTWDVHLRQEVEVKKVGLVIDTCWISGWIHLLVSTDLSVSNFSAQYNFARFYQVGSSQGRPNCTEYFNITSLGFYEGMTAQGTENGKVTVTYFDSFWRECDFDRNKKKKNVVHISTLELDEESITPLTGDWAKDNERKNDKDPKVILSFVKERLQGPMQKQAEPTPQQGENLIRFYYMVRVNKVSWCPNGKFLAVGYRNGLVTIMPATFDRLYTGSV